MLAGAVLPGGNVERRLAAGQRDFAAEKKLEHSAGSQICGDLGALLARHAAAQLQQRRVAVL